MFDPSERQICLAPFLQRESIGIATLRVRGNRSLRLLAVLLAIARFVFGVGWGLLPSVPEELAPSDIHSDYVGGTRSSPGRFDTHGDLMGRCCAHGMLIGYWCDCRAYILLVSRGGYSVGEQGQLFCW